MYNDFYGFRMAPFSATPDPQFFFTNRLYQEAFATLQYGVLAKKGFVVVTGEVGTGKTTLLRKLLHSLGSSVHSVFIFNTQVTFIELLRLVLDDLGLPRQSDDKLTLIAALNQYLLERLEAGHIVALLVDEAQNLSDEVLEGLRLLSNLETDTEKLLQIVLMGQPELEKRLAQPKLRQLKQRVTLHSRLAPLGRGEVAGYIQFRLDAVGHEGKRLFSPSAVDEIATYSKGIPRLINIICDNALLLAFADSKKEISREMIREVAADLRLEEKKAVGSDSAPSTKAAVRQEKDLSWLKEAHDVPDDAWVTNIDSVNVSPQPVASPTRRTRKLRWAGLGLTWALAAIGVAAVVAALDLRQTGDYRLETFSRTQEPVWSTSDNVAPRRPESQPAQPRTSSVAESPRPPEPRPDPVTSAKAMSGQAKARAAGDRAGVRKDPPEISKAVQPENQRKRIEAEVQAALQNRAIDGVVVSVVDGTAYLDGRVASLRQKTMAERAARSVAEVKRVRNRLDVTTARIYRNSWRDASVTRE
jgi:type II secretory pathway predicted ATPase ExeA